MAGGKFLNSMMIGAPLPLISRDHGKRYPVLQ